MSEEEKPKLSLRPKRGVKRTTEVSQVKQSFSHGRVHKVVVETKKARTFRRKGEAAPVATETPAEEEKLQVAEPVEPVAKAPEAEAAPSVAPAMPTMPKAPPPPFLLDRDEPVDQADTAPAKSEKKAEDAPEVAKETSAAAKAVVEKTPVAEKAVEPPAAKAVEKPAEAPVAAAPQEAVKEQPAAKKPAAKKMDAKPRAKQPAKAAKKPTAPPKPALSPLQKAMQNKDLTPRERQQLLLRVAEEERLKMAE